MKFWAHSDPTGLPPGAHGAKWQPLSEHLENVGNLARQLAMLAAPDDEKFHRLAESCGLLHDFGKYSDGFQKMITAKKGRCQHAVHGASIAYFGADGLPAAKALHVALAVAGHHAGISDLKGKNSLENKINANRGEAMTLVERALGDCDRLRRLLAEPFPVFGKDMEARFDLYTRMLFSCLVDADRLDTSGRPVIQQSLNASERLQRVLVHINGIGSQTPDGAVKKARANVLADCLHGAGFSERLVSLTVPTGGGKTLASMAWALKRAELNPELYRRIIVVIPYLSIIEQNASIYKDVLGSDAVLEHHSGSFARLTRKDDDHYAPAMDDKSEEDYETSRKYSIETENWDSPLIVTTSVRFFESLFSNHPSDLRRVHNIARSIIILDEVQTLPRRLLSPLLAMMRELADNWGCTFLFSTATQPALQRPQGGAPDGRWPTGTMREIVRDADHLRSALKRVRIEWELEKTVSWVDLSLRIGAERSCLAIVNTRDHANALYSQLKAHGLQDGLFHLSTRMCAAHRLDVLARIRRRLKDDLPCIVVSTQLVEAGVDLDFPIVFRALGPLDSIFQAAGRADREGRLTEALGRPGGRVIVFIPEDPRLPPNEYKEATGKTRALAQDSSPQVDSVEAIQRYFERYYGEQAELGESLQRLRTREENYKFATLAEEFEIISSRTQDVFVPYDDQSRAAIEEVRQRKRLTRDLRTRLQRYVVGLYPNEFSKARGVLEEIQPDGGVWAAVDQAYSDSIGLTFELPAETFVVSG